MYDAIAGFELSRLLAPVPGDTPAGVDPRQDFSPQAVYYRLRDARAEARAIERQMDGDDPENPTAAPTEQWATVRRLAGEALASRAKDLEVAAWMMEALIRSEGLPGMIFGCRLLAGLVDQFWEHLFPLPDEDGLATKLGPIAGLNGEGGPGTLIQPLQKVLLVHRPDGAPLALYQVQQSEDLAKITDEERRRARIAAGVIPFDTLETEFRLADAAERAALRDDATAALGAWNALADLLAEKAGADAPPSTQVRQILQKMLDFATRYAPAMPAGAGAEPQAGAPAADAAPALSTRAAPGAALSRAEALNQLDEIATFFRNTEPNSPLSYTLREAARRGRMSWPDLLAEVVPDRDTRRAILSALGIKPPEEA